MNCLCQLKRAECAIERELEKCGRARARALSLECGGADRVSRRASAEERTESRGARV